MLRSLMTAVTGVKAHQTMLDVTGNNIANVNTTGYKKDFTIFQDLLYQTSQGASGPGDNRGGINPSQVGLGVTVASIETIHSQGPAQYTGNKSDMMINGDGFFVLRSGASTLFSRAGAFVRDENNNLVQSGTGYRVQGYKMERDPLNPQNFVRSSELSDINIPMGKKMEPRATTVMKFQCNLDSRANPYLPIGFEDLPYNNPPCGEPATVKISKIEGFEMEFKSNPSSGDGTGYLTVTIRNGGAKTESVYDMVGIDKKTGRPILKFASTTGTDLPGVNPPIAKAENYDPTTGVLQINDLKVPLFPKMHYKQVLLKDPAGAKDLPLLMEFDEKPDNFKTSPVKMAIWAPDAGGKMKNFQVLVHLKPDGTFDKVEPKSINPGIAPFDKDGAVRIKISESGKSLEFQVAKDLTAAADPEQDSLYGATTDQISQGGIHQTKKDIFDCKGNPYTLEVNFKKITENRWRWEAFLVDSEGKRTAEQVCNSGESSSSSGNIGASGELSFCRCGQYCDVETNKAELDLPFSLDGGKNQKVTLSFGGDGDPMNGVTQFASETTTKAIYQDGYKMGVLNDFNVGVDGTISGTFSNGQVQKLYRVALATFPNQQGLEKTGETAFIPTINSGEANIDAADSGGKGSIKGATLEMSNVDLTEEFTRLIISQRGFQANTRVVTTSDQILEEVVNLKR